MSERRKGGVRTIRGIRYARVRIGKRRRVTVALPHCKSDASARSRAAIIAEIANLFGVERWFHVREFARSIAKAETDRQVRILKLAAERMAQTAPKIGEGAETFEHFADRWTSGALHREHPDHVRLKDSRGDIGTLRKWVNPIIGPLPLVDVTLDHADAVMRSLPDTLSKARRRHVAQVIHRVLKIAAYPARIIDRSPLPPGWLPKLGPDKARPYLYPDEDARLLGCIDVEIDARLLYGVLGREGMRVSEALATSWADFDLVRGTVVLDENKTDDPRAWALDPGVVRALTAWKRMRGGEGPFTNVAAHHIAKRMRADLAKAGIDRPELFRKSDVRRPMRIHDFRATFVTLSLAAGKTETWVQDRTGHRSTLMIAKYRRAARTVAELGLGTLRPLDEAIPEFAKGGAHMGSSGSGGPSNVISLLSVAPPGLEPGRPERTGDFKATPAVASVREGRGKQGVGSRRRHADTDAPLSRPIAAAARGLAVQMAEWDVYEILIAEEAGIRIPKREGKS